MICYEFFVFKYFYRFLNDYSYCFQEDFQRENRFLNQIRLCANTFNVIVNHRASIENEYANQLQKTLSGYMLMQIVFTLFKMPEKHIPYEVNPIKKAGKATTPFLLN